MEGLKELVAAYYHRSSNEEMAAAVAFFRRLGGGGASDGTVSLHDLRKSLPSWLSAGGDFLRQLDEDGDGMLDFDQALTAYYCANMKGRLVCDGCQDVLLGPFFSCRLCLDNSSDLCSKCYQRGNVVHEHSLVNLQDHLSLLSSLAVNYATIAEKSLAKKEMEELHEIARSHYLASSPEVQDLAKNFFSSMDSDGDGKIDVMEFLALMKQEGHAEMRRPDFFCELDKDGNGSLDFFEVMTLYYVIKSGRPFCDGCGCFIPGMFFSCVDCFSTDKNPVFNLCHSCYRLGTCKHSHGGRTHFMDNYTLLQAITYIKKTQSTTTTATDNDHAPECPDGLKKWKVALNAFEAALNASQFAAGLMGCTIL